MYSIVFGLVVTGGMLVMVAVGPSQGRGPAWKFVGSIVDIHLTVWLGSVGAPLTMFHDPTAYTSLQVSSCIFNGGPRRAKNTDNGDTTVKLQVPSAISSLPRLLCDAGTNLGWAATNFWGNPILNSVLEIMNCTVLRKDGKFAPMFSNMFSSAQLHRFIACIGELCGAHIAQGCTIHHTIATLHRYKHRLLAGKSLHTSTLTPCSTIFPGLNPPKKKQVSIEGGCPREKETWYKRPERGKALILGSGGWLGGHEALSRTKVAGITLLPCCC